MRTLVFLQNAWYKDPERAAAALKRFGREFHVRALQQSRTGRRLMECFPLPWDSETLRFANTTPELAPQPTVLLPPKLAHVRKEIDDFRPGVILACGKQAKLVMLQVGYAGPLVCIPHPAWRPITNEMLSAAGEKLPEAVQEDLRIEMNVYAPRRFTWRSVNEPRGNGNGSVTGPSNAKTASRECES